MHGIDLTNEINNCKVEVKDDSHKENQIMSEDNNEDYHTQWYSEYQNFWNNDQEYWLFNQTNKDILQMSQSVNNLSNLFGEKNKNKRQSLISRRENEKYTPNNKNNLETKLQENSNIQWEQQNLISGVNNSLIKIDESNKRESINVK